MGPELGNATKSVTIKKGSIGDRKYIATWAIQEFTISYSLDGGSISGQRTSYNVETDNFTLPQPTKTGYEVTGWSGTGLSANTLNVTVNKGSTGNRSYTAHWRVVSYTITYNLAGGSISGQKT